MFRFITINKWNKFEGIIVVQYRNLSKPSAKMKEHQSTRPDKIQAWQIHAYGNLDELKLSNTRMPVISKPTDVLVKVEAASINPIDTAMLSNLNNNLLKKSFNKVC